MRFRRWVVALGLVPVMALTACGSDSTSSGSDGSSPSTSAAPSGSLVVYSGRNEGLIGPILKEFTAETGVEIELRTGDSGELAAQILTEGSASPADVFISQDAGALGALAKQDMFTELDVAVINRVPEAFRAVDDTWVGLSGRARVIAYNPTLVPDPPTTIDELTDPQWKGKIGFAPTNASWQSFVTALRLVEGEQGAEDWLRAFAANDPKPYQNNGAVRDAVNSGEISLGLINHYYLWQKIAQEGEANVVVRNGYLDPGDPGGLVNVAGIGILASASNMTAAEALVDFLLGEVAQTYFAEKTFEYPLVEGVAASAALVPLDELEPPAIDLADLDSLAETQELLEEVGLLTQ